MMAKWLDSPEFKAWWERYGNGEPSADHPIAQAFARIHVSDDEGGYRRWNGNLAAQVDSVWDQPDGRGHVRDLLDDVEAWMAIFRDVAIAGRRLAEVVPSIGNMGPADPDIPPLPRMMNLPGKSDAAIAVTDRLNAEMRAWYAAEYGEDALKFALARAGEPE